LDGSKTQIKASYSIESDQFRMVAQFKSADTKDCIPALDTIYRKTAAEQR